MRRKIRFLLVLLSSVIHLAQAQDDPQTDSLKFCKADAFSCSSVYWRIVARGKAAIPYLIAKLNDPTPTEATHKCKTGPLCVGDLAYLALEEIIPLPFFAVTGIQCDAIQDGCALGVFEYIASDREKFKGQVQAWYDQKKKKFRWKNYSASELNDCYRKNHITGHYTY